MTNGHDQIENSETFDAIADSDLFLRPPLQECRERLEPAATVIEMFRTDTMSGENALAEILGCTRTAVYKTQMPERRGGRGGYFRSKHLPLIMRAAQERGLKISPYLIMGYYQLLEKEI